MNRNLTLSRATTWRPAKEARKGQRIQYHIGVRGNDLLHSLSYWRLVRRTDAGAIQYAAHRAAAFGSAK